MPLPVIEHPLFSITLPSTNDKITFRPFTVKEEKILLSAYMEDTVVSMMDSLKQILINCVVSKGFDPDDLTMLDFEYLWLQLRAKSVNNIIELRIKDEEDNQIRTFKFDINDLEIKNLDKKSTKIKITDDIGIVMQYPTLRLVTEMDKDTDPFRLIAGCIQKIYEGEDVMTFQNGDYTIEEAKNFIESLPSAKFEAINEFIENVPYIQYTVSYKNENGVEKKIEIKGIASFFQYASGT